MCPGHRLLLLFLLQFLYTIPLTYTLPVTEKLPSVEESIDVNIINEIINNPEVKTKNRPKSIPEDERSTTEIIEVLLTTDHTTTAIPWEGTTILDGGKNTFTTLEDFTKDTSGEISSSTTSGDVSKDPPGEISSSTTESSKPLHVTPPSIDSKDFLSEIQKTTLFSNYDEEVTNVLERKTKTTEASEETDPSNLPWCEDSLPEIDQDYQENAPESFLLESAGESGKSRSGDGWSDPIITSLSETSLTVTWNPPTNNITVLFYVVAWSHSSNAAGQTSACKSSNETFNHTISDLQPCTKYDVRVTPFTSDGPDQSRVVSETTSLIVEKDSLNLKVLETYVDWIKISWNLPNNECVLRYVVNHCDSRNCTKVDINETAYNATELLPCTKSNFTVSVHGKGGEYGSTSIESETNFLEPGKPSPAWTESGKNSLKIFWTSPIGYTCINYYRVTLSLDGESKITHDFTTTSATVKSLLSCREYDVTIVPVHKNGENNPEVIQSNRTFPSVLAQPVVHRWPFPDSNSVQLSWRIYTNENNNCEEAQLKTRCNFTTIMGKGYDGKNATAESTIPKGTNLITKNLSIINLSPFTRYNCYGIVENSQGQSEESMEIMVQTLEDVPSAPSNFAYSDVEDTNFQLHWNEPRYLPGNLTGFEIKLIRDPKLTVPPWCPDQTEIIDTIKNIEGDVFTWNYTNAVPFSTYRTKIQAKTHAGWGKIGNELKVQTAPGAPGPVSNLNYSILPNPINPNLLEFFLTWARPCDLNGERIESYNITAVGERRNYEDHKFMEYTPNNDSHCINDVCSKKLTLKEEYTYTFYVAGRVVNHDELGEKNTITAMFPPGIPPPPESNYTDQIKIDPYKARRTTTTATILLPVFSDTYGQIRCYAIIVAKSGYNNGSYARIDLNNGEWPDTPSWAESEEVDFQIPYQAIKFCDTSNPSYIVDYGSLKAVRYTIGDDTINCPEFSSNRFERSYCNGPLKPDTWYDVRIRAFTNGGYRDSIIFTVKTNAELRVAVVIGTIFGILFLGILTTMMLLVRKCSIQAVLRRFLHSDMPGSPVPAPFTRRKFIAHCQQLADNPGKLSNEFQLLQTLSVDLQMPTNAACLQVNRKKNRYTDILPYDFSRVKLEALDSDPNSDYINASFIKGFTGEEEYIACQGPKEETTYDFWRMIDQYDVKLIIMLTQLVEKNKEKCHQYFPTIRETFTYENMSIRCSTELDYRTYTQRTLVLQKENEKRTIVHLHFKDWPDHDVPEDCDPMINFCQIMRRHISANPGLAVVHCSAGIGRTGTLIAIDILLQHIKDNRKLDVFGTVYRLRHHRINMVQRESQYAYIYNCIRQVLKNPYFSKTYKPPSVDPITDNNINGKKKEASITNLVNSLETLKKSSLSTSVESADEILNSSSSTSSSPKSRNCLSLQSLRYSKSTSAICSKPFQDPLVRYNTLEYPVYELDKEDKSSTSSLNDSDASSSSFYENLQPMNNRSKSTHLATEDPTVTEKLLDTSL